MSTNTVLGAIVVLVILIGGYFLISGSMGSPSGMATTTTSGTTSTSGTPQTGGTPSSSASAPGVQTDASAVPSNSTAVVKGWVTPNGAPTTYWYEYGKTNALGSRTAAQAIGSGFTPIPSPGYITGLEANTTYYFRLSAQNTYGTINGATHTFTTNANTPPQGSVPTVLTNAATGVSRTSADLHGHVTAHGSETTYWFEYGLDASLGNITALRSAGSGSASMAVAASVTGLQPATKYYYRLNAQNQFGTVNGSIQNFTTDGPSAGAPAVNTNAATNIATSSATLNGHVDPHTSQTTYWFEYGKNASLGKDTQTVVLPAGNGNTAVSADVTGLSKNTKYFFRVVARNSEGTTRGDTQSFKTNP